MTLPKVITVASDADAAVKLGDDRGAYGFGRSAHGSNPQATYCFESSANATSSLLEHVDDVAGDFANAISEDVEPAQLDNGELPDQGAVVKTTSK